MRMRVLSLTQPWATLVAIGAKRIETRSWTTSYRGPVAIHAAKGFPRWARDIAQQPEFVQAYIDFGHGIQLVRHDNPDGGGYHLGPDTTVDLPTGVIVAVANLFNVRSTDNPECAPDPRERLFGDYTTGRYAWYLNNRVRLAEPIEWRGAQGLRWGDVPVCQVCRNNGCGATCEADETRAAAR